MPIRVCGEWRARHGGMRKRGVCRAALFRRLVPVSKRFGDAWVAASPSLGLLVPSVVASEEKNLMLNPSHPRFQEVRVLSKRRVVLDKRLYSIPAKGRSSAQKKK
jgi:hypothetical protein